jgi:hypothetical protein
MTEQGQSTRVSRRTIAKGAAWAVPVVPLVAATPAYAATGDCIILGPESCKYPGQSEEEIPWGYELEICNECGVDVTITDVRKNNGPLYTDPTLDTVYDANFLLEAGDCVLINQILYSSNSANFLEIDYVVVGTTTTITVDKIESPPRDCPSVNPAIAELAP